MYELRQVDLAGNDYPITSNASFEYICEQAVYEKRASPNNLFYIINPDNVDVDWSDGLTDEERELLP